MKLGLIIATFIMILSLKVDAYTLNHSSDDGFIKWKTLSTNIVVNPANSRIAESDAQAIINSALTSWNEKSDFNIQKTTTNSAPSDSRNDLYFNSENPFYAGVGVVGVTSIAYNNITGEIKEADIIINDDVFNISTDSNSSYYLGNVVSHELGHFLGLGHSTVLGSTMFYRLFKGQGTLHTDDHSGARALYGPNLNVIEGKIVGEDLVPVFGANVHAVSSTTGKVVAADISNSDGTYSIKGLENDHYYIYTAPLDGLNVLPEYYEDVKKNFCTSGSSYRGSFFQACRTSSEGIPQTIDLSSGRSIFDTENISIRCNLDVPVDYFSNKTDYDFINFTQYLKNSYKIGSPFVGYFTRNDVDTNVSDVINIDFSTLGIDDITADLSDDLYLEVKVTNQDFFSAYRSVFNLTRADGSQSNFPSDGIYTSFEYDSDNNYEIDAVMRMPVDMTSALTKSFTLTITPYDIDFVEIGSAGAKENTFPGIEKSSESMFFYLFQAHLVKKNTDGSYTKVDPVVFDVSDNSLCLDASQTYSMSSSSDIGSGQIIDSSSSGSRDVEVAGCASVAFINNDSNGSGPKSMLIVFSMMMLITLFRFKALNQ